MKILDWFRNPITKERMRIDFKYLEDLYAYELLKVEESGINDVIVLHYQLKNINEIKICRDRGYYEISMKINNEYLNIAYEFENNIKNYHEYYGKNGYERLIQEAKGFIAREIGNTK